MNRSLLNTYEALPLIFSAIGPSQLPVAAVESGAGQQVVVEMPTKHIITWKSAKLQSM